MEDQYDGANFCDEILKLFVIFYNVLKMVEKYGKVARVGLIPSRPWAGQTQGNALVTPKTQGRKANGSVGSDMTETKT